ncbi:YkoP family protein [Cohnella hashimotonis]|uniref:Polysaccharide deacetylase n=1 Tax=Cohnella hashimotonis TaxID=2826895 RepID=A0ABT6TDY5_9BACL|nr:polysaccharide deacetylase [Cohnella hashimotonis]MDI4644969.1 polysaccharide deacetylase [Cohnella hashimotonis]
MDGSTQAKAPGLVRRGEASSRFTVRQKAWLLWEKVVWLGMEWRSEDKLDYGMCKLLVKRYSGEPIVCADGTRIETGDRIGELHLDNRRMLELSGEVGSDRAALKTARLARASLRRIAEAMEVDPRLAQVKGVMGTTLLHRGLIHGLGFECRPMPSRTVERWTAAYLQTLLSFLHPAGRTRTQGSKDKLVPMQLIHSRQSLKRSMGGIKHAVS